MRQITTAPDVDLDSLLGKTLASGFPQGRIVVAKRYSQGPAGIAFELVAAGGKTEFAGFLDGETFTVTPGEPRSTR